MLYEKFIINKYYLKAVIFHNIYDICKSKGILDFLAMILCTF